MDWCFSVPGLDSSGQRRVDAQVHEAAKICALKFEIYFGRDTVENEISTVVAGRHACHLGVRPAKRRFQSERSNDSIFGHASLIFRADAF